MLMRKRKCQLIPKWMWIKECHLEMSTSDWTIEPYLILLVCLYEEERFQAGTHTYTGGSNLSIKHKYKTAKNYDGFVSKKIWYGHFTSPHTHTHRTFISFFSSLFCALFFSNDSFKLIFNKEIQHSHWSIYVEVYI